MFKSAKGAYDLALENNDSGLKITCETDLKETSKGLLNLMEKNPNIKISPEKLNEFREFANLS